MLLVHRQARILRYCGMKGEEIKEKEGSAIRMYIRSTSDVLPKYMKFVYITKLEGYTKYCGYTKVVRYALGCFKWNQLNARI